MAVMLMVAGLVPVFALRAQQPPPPGNEPTAKDVVKAVEKADATAISSEAIDRIKEEGLKHSQVMATLSYLTDVIGPRLTASPNMKRANEWTRDKLKEYGLENSHLEAWGPFGRGWTLKRFSAQVIEPQCIPLIAYPKAWSPGTDGTLVAEVVYFDAKTDEEFAKFKGKLKGAIVLTSSAVDVPAHFEPLATRTTDSELLELADASEPTARRAGAPIGKAAAGPAGKAAGAPEGKAAAPAGKAAAGPARGGRFMSPEMLARMELQRKKAAFLKDEDVAMLVDPSLQGDGGTLFVAQASIPGAQQPFGGGGGAGGGNAQPAARRQQVWDKDAPKMPAQMVVSKEHYNRLVRMAQAGEKIKMAVDLAVQFHDEDLMGYNTVAEITGTDLKDELVMLGGHMDSWHSGTGATDNAAGVSCAIEAVRILKALNLKPRRTIRVALWSGEEEGLLGSRAYVTQHFGKTPSMGFGGGAPPTAAGGNGDGTKPETSPTAKADFEKFQAYFNLDNGTGKIRGVYLQGNEAARTIFRKWLQPFKEMGASTITLANTGGTDHQSFDGIGLPGFQFIQDVIEYNSRTHHSNQDLFDRIQADDMKQASVIMAAFVYNAAMTDEKIPRKPASGGRGAQTPIRAASN
jgi:hypothetical protein